MSKIETQLPNSPMWKTVNKDSNPFTSHFFFQALEKSESVSSKTGWSPVYFSNDQSLLYSFIKSHSYGEYIFDWEFANFYHKNNVNYYPKLLSMVPFTSATSPRFIGTKSRELMNSYLDFYKSNPFSSSHFLFIEKSERSFFESYDYILRDSFQYHFINKPYENFEHFLSALKKRKAKQIRKERMFSKEISFKRLSGDSLTGKHAKEMYQFYLSTIRKKGAIPYLNERFFLCVFENLKNKICYVQALEGDQTIAGSLFFFSEKRLYGRYWGSFKEVKNLHFELCYYQGIEFCIEKNLEVFEAGAQGEHKIARGFTPTKTYSVHKFKQPVFHNAIKNYIKEESLQINQLMAQLAQRLPFKDLENLAQYNH